MPLCSNGKHSKALSCNLLVAYGVFIFSAGSVWHLVADGRFSSIFTMSAMVQCLAVVFLALQLLSTGSASGISARALLLDALSICCRLSSTLWLEGYLPGDASGDYIFQVIDMCSLVVLVWLLRQILVVKRHTYQGDEDSMPILPLVKGALMLAALLHGDMNDYPTFDTLWMAGLLISTVAVLPQLLLITKTGGCAEALTGHYIAVMAVSRVFSGMFMWSARNDLKCIPWIGGFNHAFWTILAAHMLQILLVGDFAYFYVRAVLTSGLNARIETQAIDCWV